MPMLPPSARADHAFRDATFMVDVGIDDTPISKKCDRASHRCVQRYQTYG